MVAGARRDRSKRLLVLGAGAAQLGLLEAARERELYVIARRPRSVCARLPLRRPSRDHLRRGRAADRPPRRRRAGRRPDRARHRLAGRDRGADRRAARAAAPARPGDGRAGDLEARASASGSPRRASRSPRHVVCSGARGGDRRRGSGLGYPCVVKAPDRQGQKGLALVRATDEARGGRSRSRSTRRASSVAARRGARSRAVR